MDTTYAILGVIGLVFICIHLCRLDELGEKHERKQIKKKAKREIRQGSRTRNEYLRRKQD